LRTSEQTPGPRSRIRVRATCPVPGHTGPCHYGVLGTDGRRVQVSPGQEDLLSVFEPDPAGPFPPFPDEVRELLREVGPIDFFLLPEAIRWDLDFYAETRMADCGGAAAWLVREGQRRGLDVRFSFGLLVAKPYATPHCWAEFRVDDTWVPADPLLLCALSDWAGLDPDLWPPHRSPGGILLRLTDRFTKVASHNGIWASVSLHMEYL
jgi:hypothetical protein